MSAMDHMANALSGWGLWIALVGACLMVAALTIRLIVMPLGLMASVPLWIRLLICALSIGVMISKPTRRLVPALLTGTLLMVGYGVIH